MRLARLWTVAALFLPSLLHSQSHPLIGRWTMVVPSPMLSNRGSEPVEAVDMDALMDVKADGDSLIATLTFAAPPGQAPREPLRLAGTNKAGQMELSVSTPSTVVTHDRQVSTRMIIQTLVLDLQGDTINGELVRTLNGQVANPRIFVRGTRAIKELNEFGALGLPT